MTGRRPTPLDRQEERDALDRLIEAAREGLAGPLVLRGKPVIGKTTLRGSGVASAREMQPARVVGVEEMELDFGQLPQPRRKTGP